MLRTRMATLAQHAALGLSALNHVPQGVAVVDAQGHIQHMNGAAERLVQAGGPCRVQGGRLGFLCHGLNGPLQSSTCTNGARSRKQVAT